MTDFNKHFKMNEAEVIEYSKEKELWEYGTQLTCREIGDGNINYVFKMSCPATNKSIIIKQADILLRSSGRHLSVDRNRIVAEVLMLYSNLSPGFVPEIYLYDPVMCCIVMQHLKDYENMRYTLLENKTFLHLQKI